MSHTEQEGWVLFFFFSFFWRAVQNKTYFGWERTAAVQSCWTSYRVPVELLAQLAQGPQGKAHWNSPPFPMGFCDLGHECIAIECLEIFTIGEQSFNSFVYQIRARQGMNSNKIPFSRNRPIYCSFGEKEKPLVFACVLILTQFEPGPFPLWNPWDICTWLQQFQWEGNLLVEFGLPPWGLLFICGVGGGGSESCFFYCCSKGKFAAYYLACFYLVLSHGSERMCRRLSIRESNSVIYIYRQLCFPENFFFCGLQKWLICCWNCQKRFSV